jgi:hypothetical protein
MHLVHEYGLVAVAAIIALSALGQKGTFIDVRRMSALPSKTRSRNVRFVPKADIPAYG